MVKCQKSPFSDSLAPVSYIYSISATQGISSLSDTEPKHHKRNETNCEKRPGKLVSQGTCAASGVAQEKACKPRKAS